jgi:hypothetical protein
MDDPNLQAAALLARRASIALTVCLLLAVPLPLYASGYTFSPGFFKWGWVGVGFAWAVAAFLACTFWPLIESRGALGVVCAGVWRDVLAAVGSQRGSQSKGTAGKGPKGPAAPVNSSA